MVKIKHIWVATTQIKTIPGVFHIPKDAFLETFKNSRFAPANGTKISPSSLHFQEIQVQRTSAAKTPKINGWVPQKWRVFKITLPETNIFAPKNGWLEY